MSRRASWNLKEFLKNGRFEAVELPKDARHEIGKTYWSNYWNKYYTVLDIEDGWIRCEWQGGKVNSHLTQLDPNRDWELIRVG